MSEETYWQQGDQRAYSPLRGRRTADAVVVGGGLTGLTVALWLCRAGLRVVLLEANALGSGSTACCLGRVSLLSGVSLSRLEKRFRAGMGQRLRKLSAECLSHLQELSREKTVSWDWQTLDDRLLGGERPRAEMDAFRKAGISVEIETSFSSRFAEKECLLLRNMVALHPLRYLRFLARQGEKHGLCIFEHSRVVALETNLASTERGSVQAPYIVVATGYPIVNTPGWYFLRTIQRKGCLIPLEGALSHEGMLTDSDGCFALRPVRNGTLAQLTLQRVGEYSRQPPLEQFRQHTASYLENRPSGQIFVSTEVYSADGLPYIGPYGRRTPNLFVPQPTADRGYWAASRRRRSSAPHFGAALRGRLYFFRAAESVGFAHERAENLFFYRRALCKRVISYPCSALPAHGMQNEVQPIDAAMGMSLPWIALRWDRPLAKRPRST